MGFHRHRVRLRAGLLGTSALVAVSILPGSAHAQQYFNGSQTTANGAINGGSGVWNNTTQNWTDATGTTSNAYDPFGVFTVFGSSGLSTPATGGTVTVHAGGIQLTNIVQFTETGDNSIYTIIGGGLTLAPGGTTFDVANVAGGSSASAVISSVISGPGGVLVSGLPDGTLVLTGANTYTDDTIICSCTTLQLGNGGTTGSIIGNVFNGGTLVFNRSNVYDFTGDILDDFTAGKVVQAGSGTTILSGNNSYTGGTTITAGILQVTNNNSVGTGDVTLSGGTFRAGADGLDFSNFFAINMAGGTFDTNGKTLTISGDITDGNGPGGALTKIGAGTLILSGFNDYTGATHVKAGTLRVDYDFALPATTDMKVNSGATLEISDFVFADINSLADGPNGGGTVKIGTSDTFTILYIGANGGATTTFSGAITGPGSLSLDGGSLTLTGASSIGGDLFICECATLTIIGPGASFTATGDPFGFVQGTDVGGTLKVLNGATFATNNLFVGGSMTVDGANTSATIAGFTFVGGGPGANLTISGGAVMHSQLGAFIDPLVDTAAVTVTGQNSTWNVGDALAVGGVFGPGYLTISAGGVVTVTGPTLIGTDPVWGLGPSIVTVTGPGSVLNTVDLAIGYACFCADLAGTLTVADGGRVSATGAVAIGALGILNLGTGALGGTIVAPAITNDGQIVANFTDTVTLAANIDGSGTLQKLGSGKLILSGISTYTGATTVDGGTLAVNGSLTSSVTVNSGATLGGTGTVGTTTINGGVLSPGNSIGTITINGSLNIVGAGNYIVEVSPTPGLADRTNVVGAPGTAAVAGTLTAVAAGSGYKIDSRYTVLNAIGGVSGTFGSLAISGSYGATKPRIEYDANNVYLVLDPNALSFTGLTPNERAVAGGVNAALLARNQLVPFDALFNLSVGQLPAALDALSGEVHASVAGVLLDESLYVRNAILGRLRQASFGGDSSMASLTLGGPRNSMDEALTTLLAYGGKASLPVKAPMRAPQASPDVVFWVQGFGAWGRFNGNDNAASVRRDLAGFITGFDSRVGANGRAGIAAGYTGSKNVLDNRGSANVDTGHVAAYGGWSFGALNLRAGGAYAFHTIDTDRTIAFPGFFDRATAHYQGGTGQIFAEAGYGFNFANVAVEPFAGAAWVHLRTDAAIEKGGPAALNVAATAFETGYSTLGIRAASLIALADNMMLVPRATVAWQHAYGSVIPTAVLAFQGAGTPFAISGVPIARDSLLTEAGLDLAIGAHATLGVSYIGQLANNVQDHAAKGKFSWKF